jgi:hypothetical protein
LSGTKLNYEVSRDDALARPRLTYAHILGGEEGSATAPNDPDEGDEEEEDSVPEDESAEWRARPGEARGRYFLTTSLTTDNKSRA